MTTTNHFFDFFLPHRFAAPPLPISLRRAADSLAARALPPFSPPRRPSATAAGFLVEASTCPVEIATILAARAFTSLGNLSGFITAALCLSGQVRRYSYFKLSHYRHATGNSGRQISHHQRPDLFRHAR
jgi:hypothetical protein